MRTLTSEEIKALEQNHCISQDWQQITVSEALRQLHADRERAVYIGDSDVDVMTAKNSGMPCISVLWGFRDHDFLLAHGASILVSSPLQIL